MKNIYLIIGIVIPLLSLFLSGCIEEDTLVDTQAPVIELLEPDLYENYAAGFFIPFEANFTDNVALKTFSIDIHNNFDGHSHGRISEDPDLIKWAYKENFDLPEVTSQKEQMDDVIGIPDKVMAGPYHFIVQCIDRDGNATNYQDGSNIEIEIYLTNESMANIEITNLQDSVLNIKTGIPFNVEGKISDPPHINTSLNGLLKILITLGEPAENQLNNHDHGRLSDEHTHLFEVEFDEMEIESMLDMNGFIHIEELIDYTLSVDEDAELKSEGIDHLELKIIVHDKQGNIAINSTLVHIES